MMAGRYITPYTDYGFKYLFGTEPNKDITLELVNAMLQGKEVIKSLTLLPAEQLGGEWASFLAIEVVEELLPSLLQ